MMAPSVMSLYSSNFASGTLMSTDCAPASNSWVVSIAAQALTPDKRAKETPIPTASRFLVFIGSPLLSQEELARRMVRSVDVRMAVQTTLIENPVVLLVRAGVIVEGARMA